MAKECPTLLAPVQAHFPNLSALVENLINVIFVDICRKAANPNCPTIVWLLRLWHCAVLAHTVRSQGLVFGIVHPDRHTLDWCSGQICRLVQGLCLEEFDVSELAVSQLVDLQADHLHLAARLEKVDQVLLRGINGHVAHPKRMAVRWLHALWSVASAVRRLCFQTGVMGHLVHICVVYLHFLSSKFSVVLLHGVIDTTRVVKLHMSKIAAYVPLTGTDLQHPATFLEELGNLLFIRLLLHPPDPNGPAPLGLRTPPARPTSGAPAPASPAKPERA